jgi:hypothetical protein
MSERRYGPMPPKAPVVRITEADIATLDWILRVRADEPEPTIAQLDRVVYRLGLAECTPVMHSEHDEPAGEGWRMHVHGYDERDPPEAYGRSYRVTKAGHDVLATEVTR